MKIGRTLFWFKDGDENLSLLADSYFFLGVLMNRLLNERYKGPKITFINLDFFTDETFHLHPKLPKNEPYYYRGHLRFYGTFDYKAFRQLDEEGQKLFIWTMACDFLSKSAEKINNAALLEATDYALKKGLELKLNADYRLVQSEVSVCGRQFIAAVWVHFTAEGMYSRFSLEDDGKTIFSKDIDATRNGVEFFLEMYKSIVANNNIIIIKGHRDVEYLPLKIPIACAELGRGNF